MDALEDMPARIRRAYKARRLSQRAFAEIIGATPQQMNNWLRGRAEPSIRYLARISVACGVSIDWLALGIGQRPETIPLMKEPVRMKERVKMKERAQ